MGEKEYNPNCDGCKRSYGVANVPGGIAILPGDWVLNQYQGDEGFLGWIALQPRQHRIEFTDLEPNELSALGGNIKDIELSLREYWKKQFLPDEIKRVYVVYFYESVYDKQKPTTFHLHIHLIPRTKLMDKFLREYLPSEPDPFEINSAINAWNIYKIYKDTDFPKEYRYDKNKGEDKQKALDLMDFLRNRL